MAGDQAKVAVIDQSSGKKYTMLLPTDALIKQILPALTKQLGLPTEGSGATPMWYALTLEAGEERVQLEGDKTLADAGVQDGAVLRIMPELTAGGPSPYDQTPLVLDMTAKDVNTILSAILERLGDLEERIEAIEDGMKEAARAFNITSTTSDKQTQSQISVDDSGPHRARISIIDQASGKKYNVILPTNVTSQRLLPVLIKELGLPTEGPGGAPIRYALTSEAGEERVRLGENMTLAEAGIQDGAVLQITPFWRAGGYTAKARVHLALLDHVSGKKTQVEVPTNVSMKRLIPALVGRLGLLTDANGQPVTYRLRNRDTGERIGDEQTLAEAGVKDGAVLALFPEVTAGCFLAGTMVSLPDGVQVPIENLKVGDNVLSYNVATGTLCSGTISEVIEDLVEFYLIVNGTLRITKTHLIYSNGKWTRAGDLRCGDHLRAATDGSVVIESLERRAQRTKVYNLCLASDTHTFFAEGILVHNHQNKMLYASETFEAEESKYVAEAFAVAQIEGYQEEAPLVMHKEYKLLAGILSHIPTGFAGVPIQLPDADVVEIDVVVRTTGMEVLPHWVQKVRYFRGRDSGLLEFRLIPREAGQKQILVEYYHQRHWLGKIQFEAEVVEAQQLVPA